MWEDNDNEKQIYSCCEYDSITGTYIVTVTNHNITLSESFFYSSYPDMGMNIDDTQHSFDIADDLAKKLEEQYGSKSNSGD